MKKWNAFFLLLAVSLCATVAVLAEQPVEFPAGYITGEQTELVSEHFRVSIEPGVYVPGNLTEYLEKIYNAIETASGIRFEDGPYYRTISVVCHAKAVSEEGEGYVPSAYQNRVILYPPDILENGNYAIIHELSHVLNYFYHKASQPWESTLIAEGFAEYNTYKTIQWIEKNDLALAYAVGTSNQVLLNTMLNDESA